MAQLNLKHSDSIILLIFGLVAIAVAFMELHYGKAFTLSRYNSHIVEQGSDAFEWAVNVKLFLGGVSLLLFVVSLMKRSGQ